MFYTVKTIIDLFLIPIFHPCHKSIYIYPAIRDAGLSKEIKTKSPTFSSSRFLRDDINNVLLKEFYIAKLSGENYCVFVLTATAGLFIVRICKQVI